ncbi:MAG TPA: hypothetical protein IGS53_11100 [Leptolyngbyaceae cyanobacterium M33_DOE_097]|nr:hypothetical protein [Leptolyngbyaceae cyanobacterium M33_DOE_097]
MVCSPEQARLNGAKSKGAVTDRGKAISSRNATKHGVSSTHPPLLVTEDLESFQGMMQALIDEYQPQTPTEHLLIQQVSMAWLRLHRLWSVEAATANTEILTLQASIKYPPYVRLNELSTSSYSAKPWALAMQEERTVFEHLILDLKDNLNCCPSKTTQYTKWIRSVEASIYQARSGSIDARNNSYEHLNREFWLIWGKLHDLIYDSENGNDDYRKPLTRPEVMKVTIEEVIEAAQKEIAAIDQQLAAFEEHSRAIAQAEANRKGLQNPELFSRYERHITTQLNESLERLAQLKQRRNNGASMGSFCPIECRTNSPTSKM